ncbi:hypothetical protein FRC02_002477 [Tulasnella sp. 418]|nr:hypothetical protein FRC02_002477 [Tulasnella sp. 418]
MAISREDAMDITFDNVEVVEKPSIPPQPSEEPPNHHVRWFHAGPTTLLSIAPITLSTTTNWQPLTREESDLCEEAWRELTPEDQAEASQRDIDPNEDDDDMKIGIPISRDRLFEVDVKAMKLYPVFWSTAGEISVMRGQWMHDETRPVETPMSQILENAYRAVKPWHSSYVEELQTALEHGYEALDKLKHPLVSASLDPNSTAKPDTFVIFEDEAVARVFTCVSLKIFDKQCANFLP